MNKKLLLATIFGLSSAFAAAAQKPENHRVLRIAVGQENAHYNIPAPASSPKSPINISEKEYFRKTPENRIAYVAKQADAITSGRSMPKSLKSVALPLVQDALASARRIGYPEETIARLTAMQKALTSNK